MVVVAAFIAVVVFLGAARYVKWSDRFADRPRDTWIPPERDGF